MFKKDVTQIQALHKITEQLMSRKQKAEEILWETLQDVLYLRTGNSDSLVSAINDGISSGVDGTPSNMHHMDLTIEGTVKSGGTRSTGFSHKRAGKDLFVSTYNHRGRGRGFVALAPIPWISLVVRCAITFGQIGCEVEGDQRSSDSVGFSC